MNVVDAQKYRNMFDCDRNLGTYYCKVGRSEAAKLMSTHIFKSIQTSLMIHSYDYADNSFVDFVVMFHP